MNFSSTAACAALALLTFTGTAQAQEFQGFAEVRGAWNTGVTGQRWQLVERVRPSFSTELAERIKLSATLEAGLAQGRLQRMRLCLPPGAPNPGPAAVPGARLYDPHGALEIHRL